MSSSSEQFQAGHTTPGSGEAFRLDPASTTEAGGAEQGAARGALGLFDAINIIVGIVVGAGIYQTVPFIFCHTDSPLSAMLLWVLAGVLSLIGALCYAELATTYPRDGGDIVYLNRAYGDWAGFLFGWGQLTVILTGSIGMMAFVFSNYAIRLFSAAFNMELGIIAAFVFAGGAVLLLTVLNVLGVAFGKTVQNVLTVAKVIGLVLIVVAGFMAAKDGAWSETSISAAELQRVQFPGFQASLGVALILMLYTFGGWNDAAFVAAEVKDGKKNITRALIIGILVITLLYLLVNAAYINALGFQDSQRSNQIAADVLQRSPFGVWGETLMCVIVMISALGAVNGLIFTGARVYSTVGKDYAILGWMASWDRKHGAPVPALVTQGVLALVLIFLVGTTFGRDGINWVLGTTQTGSRVVGVDLREQKTVDGKTWLSLTKVDREEIEEIKRKVEDKEVTEKKKWLVLAQNQKEEGTYLLKPMDWDSSYLAGDTSISDGIKATRLAKGGFDTLLACTAPVFWAFFLLTGLSVFVLRERDPRRERPFKVPFYPVLPLIFCLSCGYMLYSSIDYAALDRGWKGGLFLLGVLPLLIGIPLYYISRAMGDQSRSTVDDLPPN